MTAFLKSVLGAVLIGLAWPFVRLGLWTEDRTGAVSALSRTLAHKVPPGARWSYVWGSATLFALILQVVTGITLALIYTPSTQSAYASVQFISRDGSFSHVVRGMHYFGASAMIVLIGVHLARVYLTAAYKYPREMNWIVGVGLLAFTAAMAFTGQLLRWDQNAMWSAVVGAEQGSRTPVIGTWLARFILGGNTLNGESLSRYFSAHVFWLPALLLGGVGFHLYLVLRNGVSEPAEPGKKVDPKTYRAEYQARLKTRGVPFWPDAAWRDVVAGTAVVLIVVALAYFFGPPQLGKPPDPTNVMADPQPDWYFIWYFALLALWPYRLTNALIIAVPLLIFGWLFVLPLFSNTGERSALKRPWAVALVGVFVTCVGALTAIGYREPWLPRFDAPPLPQRVVASQNPQVVRGAELWHLRGCEYCHMIEGRGGLRGPNLSAIGDKLDLPEIKWWIANGGYGMPPYGPYLSAHELDLIAGFLATRHGGRVAQPSESHLP